ncbi:MAG: BREX system ATP-binding domain-containing protein [Candidatus Eremiobacterota bacterium]
MSEIPQVGSTLTHPFYGQGTVVRHVRGGRYLMVAFGGNRVPYQIRPEELNPPEPAPPPPTPVLVESARPEPPRPAPPLPPARPRDVPRSAEGALKVLEALRLGVVPSQWIESYTVAREVELQWVDLDLEEAAREGSARVFLGDYGTGKTHLLESIEQRALSQNFLVARLTLDDDEVSAAHPKRVYRALINALRYPDQPWGRGLAPLFDRLLEARKLAVELERERPGFHHYLSPTLAYYRELAPRSDEAALLEGLMDWIEGHPSESNLELEPQLRRVTGVRGHRLYALMDYRPWAHLYAYLVGGLSVWAERAGYGGLAVLFDEAEFYALLSSASRDFADLVFGYYTSAAMGPRRCRFDLDNAQRGGHSIHRSFPPRYAERQPLYCVFAMTEDPAGVGALARLLEPDRLNRIRPLSLPDYQELCRRLVEIYRLAYPDFTVGAEVQRPMGQVVYSGVERGVFENPRQVLKFILEMLDISRLCRDQVPAYVKEVLTHLRGESLGAAP